MEFVFNIVDKEEISFMDKFKLLSPEKQKILYNLVDLYLGLDHDKHMELMNLVDQLDRATGKTNRFESHIFIALSIMIIK